MQERDGEIAWGLKLGRSDMKDDLRLKHNESKKFGVRPLFDVPSCEGRRSGKKMTASQKLELGQCI